MVQHSLASLTAAGAFIVTENARRLGDVWCAVEQLRPDLITKVFVATVDHLRDARVAPEIFDLPIIRDHESPLANVPLLRAA